MWMGRGSSSSNRSKRKTSKLWWPSAITAWDCLRSRGTRFSRRSLPPSLTARVWDSPSAGPSLSHMAAACGLPGGAGAMGTGIWSMHYIGMLAFILPIPVAYHWPTVLLSLFAAILASVVALYVVSRQKMGASRAVAGSVLMGAGIASMHYIGMAAMRLPAICRFDSFLVVLSVVFAVLISLAALWVTFHFRHEKTGIGWEKLAGAVVMGAAIPVMHYTGMAAASFTPSGMPTDLSHAVSISTIGTAGIAYPPRTSAEPDLGTAGREAAA